MATSTRYEPPTELLPLSTAMDRLFRDAFTLPRFFGESAPWRQGLGLTSNLYETPESYILQVALPGVTSEELAITARENVVMLHGMRAVMVPEKAQSLWVGLSGGEFREEFTLPGAVAAEQATAEYQAGILTVMLPKAEQAKVKTIKVGAQPEAKAK